MFADSENLGNIQCKIQFSAERLLFGFSFIWVGMWELYSIVFTWGIRYLNKHHIWPWLYVFLCMSCPITDSKGLNVLSVQPLKKHQISRGKLLSTILSFISYLFH